MKKLCILGSTGSIGTQTLDVCRDYPEEFEVLALSANSNIYLLAKQIFEFKPKIVCLCDETKIDELDELLEDLDYNITIHVGEKGLLELVKINEVDTVVNALVGFVGLIPTLTAIENKKTIALANKESLVVAGGFIMKSAKENDVQIIPIDSEHSAIFQSMVGNNKKDVQKIILTASGGPFYGKSTEELTKVTLEDALKHPNWTMGSKVTIDSATMMNKGLELIEACWLFDVEPDNVEVVIHRKSIVHSLVEYVDHSIMAQLSTPNMRIPIQYSLTYPNRYPTETTPLSLTECGKLTFKKPDEDTFICLKACKEAIKRGGTYPAIVNGANEEAVRLFLDDKIDFVDIGKIVYGALDLGFSKRNIKLEDILIADKMGRGYANGFIKARTISNSDDIDEKLEKKSKTKKVKRGLKKNLSNETLEIDDDTTFNNVEVQDETTFETDLSSQELENQTELIPLEVEEDNSNEAKQAEKEKGSKNKIDNLVLTNTFKEKEKGYIIPQDE